MPKFRIIKRDNPNQFLWLLPNKERVWASEDEFKAFCEGLAIGVPADVPENVRPQYIKGSRLVEMSSKEFDGDFAAGYVAEFDSIGRVLKIESGMSNEQEKLHARRYDLMIGAALVGIGVALGLWLAR